MTSEAPARHAVTRVRHETRRRPLTVRTVLRLTPGMLRIIFTSPELGDFVSAAHDDHIKLRVPDPASADGIAMRDYTPRAFDLAKGELTIDFALHENGQQPGPATAWALAAQEGDTIEIGGPRGSSVTPDDFDFYLLVGDETALPAIGRRVEELRPGAPVTTLVVVESLAEIQSFETRADWRPLWATRDGVRDDAALLQEALAQWTAPEGDGHVWIGAEAMTARAVRDHMLERGHPKAWLKAGGYWIRGEAGASSKMDV